MFGSKKLNLAYYKNSDIPAKCNMYCVSFDIDEAVAAGAGSQQQGSSSSAGGKNDSGASNAAYVLPFGKNDIQHVDSTVSTPKTAMPDDT